MLLKKKNDEILFLSIYNVTHFFLLENASSKVLFTREHMSPSIICQKHQMFFYLFEKHLFEKYLFLWLNIISLYMPIHKDTYK